MAKKMKKLTVEVEEQMFLKIESLCAEYKISRNQLLLRFIEDALNVLERGQNV